MAKNLKRWGWVVLLVGAFGGTVQASEITIFNTFSAGDPAYQADTAAVGFIGQFSAVHEGYFEFSSDLSGPALFTELDIAVEDFLPNTETSQGEAAVELFQSVIATGGNLAGQVIPDTAHPRFEWEIPSLPPFGTCCPIQSLTAADAFSINGSSFRIQPNTPYWVGVRGFGDSVVMWNQANSGSGTALITPLNELFSAPAPAFAVQAVETPEPAGWSYGVLGAGLMLMMGRRLRRGRR